MAPVSGDARALEREAHAMLARYRLNGEWFDVPPELAIAAVNAAAVKLGQSLVASAGEKPSNRGIIPELKFVAVATALWAAFLWWFMHKNYGWFS